MASAMIREKPFVALAQTYTFCTKSGTERSLSSRTFKQEKFANWDLCMLSSLLSTNEETSLSEPCSKNGDCDSC